MSVGVRRRVATALRWPVGVALTSWSYIWRTTPIHRRERDGGRDDMPPPIAAEVSHVDVQRPEDGSGPLFHRTYTGAISPSRLSAVALIAHDRLLFAKEVQLHMWTSVVERVARLADGRLARGVDIEAHRVDPFVFENGSGDHAGRGA